LLDVALQGEGYFQIQTPQGIQYTRNGAFQINSQGNLVTSNGMAVVDTGGQPILFPEDARDVTIAKDGTISIITGNDISRTQLGRISIVKFADNNNVTVLGGSVVTTNQEPIPVEDNIAIQGAIENSNVNAVSEMITLIDIQRSYERAAKLIEQDNDRVRSAIDKLGQTTA
ncbi:MAG: flagellar basal-body rod protein FlgF, partial [Alphaproteobacteria bacterium]|nr:flagellar basal-body rod protein FlgF [Alphaproteobacteria bacterium]